MILDFGFPGLVNLVGLCPAVSLKALLSSGILIRRDNNNSSIDRTIETFDSRRFRNLMCFDDF